MTHNISKVILAPMEGVVDPLMRKLLCSINHYDLCISEFVRVVDSLVPKHVFYRICPELKENGYIGNRTPIRTQLLGQEPNWMAENAVRAISLGSHGVDINFGCPAKAVNKSKGGAVLLKEPETIYKIVTQVRKALPEEHEVSAKIRLGFENANLLDEIADAVEQAGANQLTIHARTKVDGYRPPAYWHHIANVVKNRSIEVIANGEIWDKTSANACIESAKTSNLMVGRGALALPNLGNVLKADDKAFSWLDVSELLMTYSDMELSGDKAFYYSSRLKQWLKYLKFNYEEASILFESIKRLKSKDDILNLIEKHSNIESSTKQIC